MYQAARPVGSSRNPSLGNTVFVAIQRPTPGWAECPCSKLSKASGTGACWGPRLRSSLGMTTQIARDNKKPSRIREGCNVNKRRGLRLGYFAAAQAAGADPHTLVAGLGLGAHRAQIDVPAPPGDVMGVTDVVAELRAFAADFTNLCHE